MPEVKEINASVPAESPAKKVRRGVSNKTQAVAQLRFHEKDAAPNGLFVGHLEEVKVDWSVNADGKQFTGMKVPRLTYHFASNHANASEKRHVYQSIFPVESNVQTIPGGPEEWKVNNVLNWIKHILDVFYLKGRQMTEEEEEALCLPFVDFDDNGEYVAIDPEEVLAGYATLFNNVVAIMDGKFNLADGETPKACYKDANGKYVSVWMKLLRHRRRKDSWINVGQNGELGFDQFIGAGAIEIQKPNTPPSILRIDLAKESITPKETKKQPTLGVPGVGGIAGGGVIAGPVDMGMANNSAFTNAGMGDDGMPF